MTTVDHRLSQLQTLEAESIHVLREVAAESERPVLLFSGGKDSIVMLELARKAFAPARIPFPVMHVDTGLNFPEVLEFRDKRVAELGVELVVASVPDAIAAGTVARGAQRLRNRIQTPVLLDAVEKHGFTAAVRRRPPGRGQGPGQGAGVLLPRRVRPVGPEEPAPRAVGPLQRPDPPRRVDPGLPAVELDRAGHLGLHRPASRSPSRRCTSRRARRRRPAGMLYAVNEFITPGAASRCAARASATAPSATRT